jgi:hypothetical protein
MRPPFPRTPGNGDHERLPRSKEGRHEDACVAEGPGMQEIARRARDARLATPGLCAGAASPLSRKTYMTVTATLQVLSVTLFEKLPLDQEPERHPAREIDPREAVRS